MLNWLHVTGSNLDHFGEGGKQGIVLGKVCLRERERSKDRFFLVGITNYNHPSFFQLYIFNKKVFSFLSYPLQRFPLRG